MVTHAARKCRRILKNAENVIAIELLCGAQAMDLFTNLKPGEGTLAAYRTIRGLVPHLQRDRIVAKDIEAVRELIRSGDLVAAVETVVGELM
jgi:histidine ammonia-lyase